MRYQDVLDAVIERSAWRADCNRLGSSDIDPFDAHLKLYHPSTEEFIFVMESPDSFSKQFILRDSHGLDQCYLDDIDTVYCRVLKLMLRPTYSN